MLHRAAVWVMAERVTELRLLVRHSSQLLAGWLAVVHAHMLMLRQASFWLLFPSVCLFVSSLLNSCSCFSALLLLSLACQAAAAAPGTQHCEGSPTY